MKRLVEVIAEIKDKRKARGKRYELTTVLTMIVVAIMCGCKSYSAVAQWGRDYRGEITQALGYKTKTPCAATIYGIMKNLNIKEVEGIIGRFCLEQIETKAVTGIIALAADGKTLRGTKKQGGEINQLMSIVSHELGVTIAQEAIEKKSNEIPKLPEMIENLDLKNKLITVDALNTQKHTSQAMLARGGNYLMVVKENQKQLFDDISLVFQPLLNTSVENKIETVEQTNIGHGRIETRKLSASSILNNYLAWPGVAQVFRLERTTYFKKSGKLRHHLVYGITSLAQTKAKPTVLLALSRGHWSIENRGHWVRDVTFGEDLSQVRSANIAQFMACFHNLVISLFRLAGFSAIAATCRSFAANPRLALALVGIINN